MKENKAYQKIRMLYTRLRLRLKPPPKKPQQPKQAETQKLQMFKNPQAIAFQLFGGKISAFLPLFKDLDSNLQKSTLKVSFKAYVSLTLFTTILVSLATFTLAPPILFFAFKIPLIPAVLFGLGVSLLAGALSIIGFYIYPIYFADKFKRDLEDELPFTTGYMAILTTAGVSPEKIFYSLASMSAPLTISTEAKNIVRDVNLFGLDVISALEKASERTPSERFREMLEGFIATVHSGSNLAAYLNEKSRQYMKLKRINLRKFSDTLSVLSEFYVALLVTGPLLLVIMLAVMAMLGGGSLGGLSPNLLLMLLTYIGIPVSSIMFLIILDAISPKW